MPGLLNRLIFRVESSPARVRRGADPAASWERNIATIDNGDAVIRYLTAGGGGPSVVFATDFPMVLEHYRELVDLLSPHARVVVFEVPGFGFSKVRSGFSFDFEPWNDGIVRFLATLGAGPYTLVFPCVAAFGALHIARNNPGLVRGVVLSQAPSWEEMLRWKIRRDRLRLLSTPLLGQFLFQVLKRKRIPAWLDLAVGDKARIQAFRDIAFDALDGGATFSLASAFQRYLSAAIPAQPPIEAPALVIWGDADQSHHRTDKDSSRILSRDVRIVHLAGVGHYPELEAPQAFAQHLLRFLDESRSMSVGSRV